MRITNGSNGGGSVSGRTPVRSGSDTKASSSKAGSATSSSTPSDKVGEELLARLRAIPDVRANMLADVEQRLNSGQLLSREAAERTAEAIVAEITSR